MSKSSALAVVGNKTNLPVVWEENSLVAYFEKIRKFPVLSEEDEKELVSRFQNSGDLTAAQQLVTSHLRLAAKIALTYRRYGLPLADIISEANIGLMQAVKKFSLDKKVRLATYAMWWIKAAINDYILRSWSLVKIGTVAAQKKLFYNLNRIKARLGLFDNRDMAPEVVEKIAKELVVDEKDVVEMNRRLVGDKSLNVAAGDENEDEKIDFIVDSRQNIEASLAIRQEKNFKRQILNNCLKTLSEREQYIITHRMLSEEPEKLDDIAVKFNISRERVRQIEKRAFERLSAAVREEMSKQKDLAA